jgi:hypothetical protein
VGRACSPGCLTARRALAGPDVSASLASHRLSAPSRRRGEASPLGRCRSGVRRPAWGGGSPALPAAWAKR